MPVKRCVCRDMTFAELQAELPSVAGDVDALVARTGCGAACGACLPYIKLMVKTGRTEFPVMRPEDIARILQEPDPVRPG